jgi:hypothetical protein
MKNTIGHMAATAFLMLLASANALSSDLVSLVNESRTSEIGKVTLQPFEIYARRDIGGAGGIYEFINNTVIKAQGICNVDKGKLPTNESIVFNEVAINFSKGAENQAGGVDYITKLPAALRNAEFEIVQNGRVLFNLPVASMHNPYTGVNQSDQWTQLGSLCYLADNVDFVVQFKFPNGQTIPAGTTGDTFPYAEVRLRGHRTIKRSV